MQTNRYVLSNLRTPLLINKIDFIDSIWYSLFYWYLNLNFKQFELSENQIGNKNTHVPVNTTN